MNYYPLQADGRVEYAVSIIHDITERKLAKEERERVVAELDATISSIPDGVLIYDPAGNIVRMNSAAERMLGHSPAQRKLSLRGRAALLRVETPDGKPFPLEELPHVRALRGETARGVEVSIRPPTGKTLWISASAAPVCTPGGALLGAVVVATDITRLRELVEQREDLLRTVSHDLRVPLAVIQAQAQLLGGHWRPRARMAAMRNASKPSSPAPGG